MARTFVAASSQSGAYAGAAATAAPITLACWFKPSNVAGATSKTLMALDDGAGAANFFILRSVATNGHCAALTQAGGSESAGGAADGVWSHHAGVFASSTSRTAYLDGVAATTDTTASTPASIANTRLGVLWAATQYADGDLAEAAIWTAALDAAEIAALAKGVSPLLIRPQALVAYRPLLGQDSPEPDRWNSRSDLTLANTPAKATHPRLVSPVGATHGLFDVPPPSPPPRWAYDWPTPVRRIHAPAWQRSVTRGLTIPLHADYVGGLVYVSVDGVARAQGHVGAGQVDAGSLDIDDLLDETPNTCTFTARGFTPTVGMEVIITLGTATAPNPERIFAGTILQVTARYVGTPANPVFDVSCIDWTWQLSKVKVLEHTPAGPAPRSRSI